MFPIVAPEEKSLGPGPRLFSELLSEPTDGQHYRQSGQHRGRQSGRRAGTDPRRGCGQGREALFVARLGHRATAVDLSSTGIADLQRDARREGRAIDAEVADVRHHRPEGRFDVVILDRTLHMLEADERLRVLRVLIRATAADGSC